MSNVTQSQGDQVGALTHMAATADSMALGPGALAGCQRGLRAHLHAAMLQILGATQHVRECPPGH